MSARHTPGPWEAQFPDPESGMAMMEGPIILGSEGQPVAEVLSVDLDDEPEGKFATGDAYLIAAAPDLLEACQDLLSILDAHPTARIGNIAAICRAEAAIARAEGRPS